jgi:hypothetical protein
MIFSLGLIVVGRFDIEEFLYDNVIEYFILMASLKEEEDDKEQSHRGSTIDRLCIPHNQALGNDMLMKY